MQRAVKEKSTLDMHAVKNTSTVVLAWQHIRDSTYSGSEQKCAGYRSGIAEYEYPRESSIQYWREAKSRQLIDGKRCRPLPVPVIELGLCNHSMTASESIDKSSAV
jgi:hypothetical protein